MRFSNWLRMTWSPTVSQYVTGSLRAPRLVVRRRTSMLPNGVGSAPSSILAELESLRRIADLRPMRLQAAALVVAVGHRQHDPVAVLVDVGARQDLAVELVQQLLGLRIDDLARSGRATRVQSPKDFGTERLERDRATVRVAFWLGLAAKLPTATKHISAASHQRASSCDLGRNMASPS